ncbi:MAG: hypothetical protein PSV13_12120 [Lacunisphaera sp.]|nr:hypothetical protein [Lacunisphaera sp.]
MREPHGKALDRVRVVHRHAWLWEPLEGDPTFLLRPMFGTRAAYLDGRMVFCFAAKTEPWRGVLVCTDRPHHDALLAEFSDLKPHPILPKWLYLPESADKFEPSAVRLVRLAARRDPRIGITPQPKRRRSAAAKARQP